MYAHRLSELVRTDVDKEGGRGGNKLSSFLGTGTGTGAGIGTGTGTVTGTGIGIGTGTGIGTGIGIGTSTLTGIRIGIDEVQVLEHGALCEMSHTRRCASVVSDIDII